jgi:hypothetical protein
MMKSIFLAGGMMIAAPVLAQAAPATGQVPQTAPADPVTTAPPQTTADQAMPTTSSDAAPAQAAQATDPATPGATPTQTQVAQVVDQQFAAYDKDGNGTLSKTEFAAWMTALKASSPGAPAESATQKTAWNDAAFKQADGDKSSTVTKTELTSFLVKGASGAS